MVSSPPHTPPARRAQTQKVNHSKAPHLSVGIASKRWLQHLARAWLQRRCTPLQLKCIPEKRVAISQCRQRSQH